MSGSTVSATATAMSRDLDVYLPALNAPGYLRQAEKASEDFGRDVTVEHTSANC